MIISGNTLYYLATIVCALSLAAKRALFSFNDWALLARCSRHIQSVFNLIVDILMDFHVDWSIDSCQKGCPLTSVTCCIGGSSVQLIEVTCFLKLSTDQLLVLIDRRDFPLMTSLLVSKWYNYNDVLYCSLSGIPCAMS